jgi:haloalkane dehalogenase
MTVRTKPDWLKKIFPWEQKALQVNGRTMAYVDEGDKNRIPVLLLSGNPTWGFLYRDFIPVLVDSGYRAVVPDWVGTGYSDHPRQDAALTLAHHIADLVSFMDQLDLHDFVIVGQDWGGPQGVGAALTRVYRLKALVLMNTWCYTSHIGQFHQSPWPWTTWHAPLFGQFFHKKMKVLSQRGPAAVSQRGMTEEEARAYHHVFEEPDSDHVVLTWPRTIPLRKGDRGWADMQLIEDRLGELRDIPVLLLWAPGDVVFDISYAHHLKKLFPQAEGPIKFDRAAHFLQDDRGPDLVKEIVRFLDKPSHPA